ncbi:hypothetical protein E2C01_000188 [Portunus trituberculatus]|uniref:Uncharacterized protein n=1 Tax=Portunus trituberculatus TaxID=210409 RepID=A0A5B7CFV0_PORTR|nr:hypothetical protein [Portunus trituberculatus]
MEGNTSDRLHLCPAILDTRNCNHHHTVHCQAGSIAFTLLRKLLCGNQRPTADRDVTCLLLPRRRTD